MKKFCGTIPKQITYYLGKARYEYPGCFWNIESFSKKVKKQQIIPATAADSEDSKSLALAKREMYPILTQNSTAPPNYVVMDNAPTKIKIFSLSSGIQFKVLVNNYYMNLDSDVLLDSILNTKIVNGELEDEFIWANIQSRLRLVRVGSDLHKGIVEYQEKQNMPILKKNKFEVGGIYQSRTKMQSIFLGFVNTSFLSKDIYSKSLSKDNFDSRFSFNERKISKSMLFCNISPTDNIDEILNQSTIDNSSFLDRCSLRDSHKFIEKIGQVKVPVEITQKIRQHANKKLKKYIVDYSNRNNLKSSFSIMNENYLEYVISSLSKFVNMAEVGKPSPEIFDVKKYLMFS